MNYRILEEHQYPEWDKFVDLSPQGSIYSKSFYLKSIGYPFKIGVVEENNRIVGGIALAKNEVGVWSNPLFVKYLGVLYAPCSGNKVEYQSLMYKIDREIIANVSGGIWSYYFHPNFKNWLNFYWKGYRQTTQYTYQINFSKSPDFRSNYGEKVRAPIKTAQKHELLIDDVDMETFAAVNIKTYQPGRPPYKKERLISLLNNLSRENCLYAKAVRDKAGNVHSVAAVVYDKKSANLILNGSDPVYKKFAGNSLLIDHMIEFASKRCEIFDFEGSIHESIEKFYRGFGGEITPYYLIYKANLPTCSYNFLLKAVKRFI